MVERQCVLHVDASDELVSFDVDAIDAVIGAGRANRFEYALLLGDLRFRVCRFADRREFYWRGRVHEGLFRYSDDVGPLLSLDDDQLLIRHHHRVAKVRGYVAGLALDYFEFPDRPRGLHYLGRELLHLGRPSAALTILDDHARREDAWMPERSESLCLAGECLERLGRSDEADARLAAAFRLDSSRREPLLRLAEACRRRGDAAGCGRPCRRRADHPPLEPLRRVRCELRRAASRAVVLGLASAG